MGIASPLTGPLNPPGFVPVTSGEAFSGRLISFLCFFLLFYEPDVVVTVSGSEAPSIAAELNNVENANVIRGFDIRKLLGYFMLR